VTTLVTGAAGFIGYHVARHLLSRGESVIGIDNLNAYYDPRLKEDRLAELGKLNAGDFAFHKVDFADDDALQDVLGPSNSTGSCISARRPAYATRSKIRAPMSRPIWLGI